MPPEDAMLPGCFLLLGGVVVTFIAIAASAPAALYVGTAVAGVGVGLGFAAAFRLIIAQASPHENAALVAATLVVIYLSFSVPALISGVASTRVGLQFTALLVHAQHAAEVAEAAAAQGHFWEMHDRLFAGQNALNDLALAEYARELELDVDTLIRELTSHAYAAAVEEDRLTGVASGVTDTPTFFIDGSRYDGSVSLSKLLATIRDRHPNIHIGETPTQTTRIPRMRWPREEQV